MLKTCCRSLIPTFLALTLALLAGCATGSRARSGESQLSAKLTPFMYYDEGSIAFIGVDTRAAQFVKDEPMFPLGLAIANKSGGSLTIKREAFTLEDEAGRRYPLVSYSEFRDSYRRSTTDANLADDFVKAIEARFLTYAKTFLPLFPSSGSAATVSEEKEIGRRQVALGYLYFSIPESGLHDRALRLLVSFEELPETYVVRFKVR